MIERLKERRLVQWALGYVGGAWVVVQVLDALADPWSIPGSVLRMATLLLALGLPVTLVLAWYHGEKGRQRVSLPEFLILTGIAGCGLLLLAALDVGRAGEGRSGTPETAHAPPSRPEYTVAVLPFLDLSPGRDQRHLSDGIAVELISALRRDGRIRVAGQSSSFALRDRPAREVGAQLGVSTVLEGSVRTEGDSMRVEANLTSTADGFTLWNREFNVPMANILQTQAEIAAAVAQEITGETSGEFGQAGRIDPEAYNLYLRGRLAWDRRSEAEMRLARDYFQRAIELEPGFAPARSGIADTYAVMGFYNYLPPQVAFPSARREAEAALRIDPDLPEALATSAYVSLYWDWDWEAAEWGFRRAIAEADAYATAHQWLGNALIVTGRTGDGTTEFRHALERDPGSMIARAGIPWTQYYDRRFQEALEGIEEVIRFDPRYMLAHYWKGWILQQLGNPQAAVAALETAVELSDSTAITLAALASAHARARNQDTARSLLNRLENGELTPNPPLYEIGKVHLALGDRDRAFAWFERAYEARALQLVFVGVDPEVDPVRDDPRFRELLARMRLD